MNFMNKIVCLRAKLNLTQKQLAEDFGVAFGTVYRWESGHAVPGRKTLMRLRYYCQDRNISFDSLGYDLIDDGGAPLDGASPFDMKS